jgi:hypothetical protein
MLTLRIFVSSPSDVGSERAVALAVTERLALKFKGVVKLEPYLWERSLLRATDTFQAQIIDINKVELAIFILWARVGTPLPFDQFHREDGTGYSSGTEYEFERARSGFAKNGYPDILCYRKTAEVPLVLKDKELRTQQITDVDAIDAFISKWFTNPNGTFKNAFYSFENAARFEQLFEAHLDSWIEERLKPDPSVAVTPQIWDGSPFRGLQRFEFEHALIYCGRTGMVAELLDSLRKRSADGRGFVMVSGMSGVGKSSLVRAGVLPLLARPKVVENVIAWRRAIYVPNDGTSGLLDGFAAALTKKDALPELAEGDVLLEKAIRDPASLVSSLTGALDRALTSERRRTPDFTPESIVKLIVVVDQFEEIFDESTTADERTRFADALRAIVQSGRAWVIIILRADFFSKCAELPENFRDLYIDRGGIVTIGGPRVVEIADMIRRPALLAGLTFERRGDPQEGLDDVLRDAASGNVMTLPLLEFTLDELWRRAAAANSPVLSFKDYDELGGLDGALKIRAEETFFALPINVQAALPKVLAALVHTDASDGHYILQNRFAPEQFSDSPECVALLDAFVDARLVVADRAADGSPIMSLAHEALLREWPPAVRWIEQNRQWLRLRGAISAAAALYGQERGRFLKGALLHDAKNLLAEHPEILGPTERAFTERSSEHYRRQQRKWFYASAAAALSVFLLVLAAVFGEAKIESVFWALNRMPAAWQHQDKPPLSEDDLANLRGSIAELARHLNRSAKEIDDRPDLVPWTVAQIFVSLSGLDGEITAQVKQLRGFMDKTKYDRCKCWREDEVSSPHSIVTAWVLHALALYNEPAQEEIAALLSRQSKEGWWSMYPLANLDKEGSSASASASATAWTALALHRQLEHGLIRNADRSRVEDSIRRAVKRLNETVLPAQARWKEYPPENGFEKDTDFMAVSALIMYVLRAIENETRFDANWLEALPVVAPNPRDSESAKGFVMGVAAGDFVVKFALDSTRHYRYPWMLITTVDAYPRGTVWQRARAVVWFEQALSRKLTSADFQTGSGYEEWRMAETLLALRHVLAVVDPGSQVAAKVVH